MPLRDHDELLMKYLDSPEAIAEYLNEAVEIGHEEHLKHALEIVRRKIGDEAENPIIAAAALQRLLARVHVALRFEPEHVHA